jgi:diguanylate cyclase (GGDEF)-like protein
VLLFDASLRIRLASGLGSGQTPVGWALVDVLGAEEDGRRIERAARRALGGGHGELTTTAEPARTLRFLPVEGEIDSGRTALVVVETPGSPIRVDPGTGDEGEPLAAAARALARTTFGEEARRTACETARAVTGAEIAALCEPSDPGALIVSSASGADLEGRSVSLGQPGLAASAFSGDSAFEPDLAARGTATAWPLRGAGALAGVWQPIRRSPAVRGVIACGWRRPVELADARLEALRLLADEAAVAIDRAAALERLTGLARTDPLTDLSNRRAWQEELRRELARAARSRQPLAIAIIDVDELKSYNDRWGHAAGDRLLLTAAARWRRRLRISDLLARVGGDEFALTLPGCTLEEAVEIGDQLRTALPEGLSCSVGVAEWTGGEPVDSLLARADDALYAAKESGRDRTCARPAGQQPTGRPERGRGGVVLPHLGEI